MKKWLIPLVMSCLAFAEVLSARALVERPSQDGESSAVAGATVLPQRNHPFLFLNSADFRRLSERGSDPELPWARKQYNSLIETADAALKEPLSIPDIPGEWMHHYVCQECGVRLREVEGRHTCPRCNKVYTGWPYDGVAAGVRHSKNIADARALGLAWQLTGKDDYAKRCLDILLAYADIYESFPIHDYRGGQAITGARLGAQTLDEAVRMISAAWAYDLIADAPIITDSHREKITNRLLRPAAGVIRRNDKGISNWQSWHNAAMAIIGYTIQDGELVQHAINGPSGIRFQMENSVLLDGFWYEGTASYHFYALNALQQQVMAMKSAGMDFHLHPVFQSMYQAPLDYMFPDGSFPAVNDSSPLPITRVAHHYEVAYSWYGEETYGAVARTGKRDSLAAFLWGARELPDDASVEAKSKNFPGLGALMLRQNSGTDRVMALHLDYGPHGGGHGHNDKLGIILFANGRDIMPDAGRLYYGAPLHRQWYKRSIAHNTVIVDGKDQKPTEGRLVSADLDGMIKVATAACDTAYKDVQLTRSLALAPEYLLDVFSGAGKRKHTWDLAYHVYGEPDAGARELQPITLPQQTNGYEVLKNVRAFFANASMSAKSNSGSFDIFFAERTGRKKGGLNLYQADTGPRQVILADGVAGADVTTCPVLLSRQDQVTDPVWITLINPDPGERKVKLAARKDGLGWRLTVQAQGRKDEYRVRDGEIKLISPGDTSTTTVPQPKKLLTVHAPLPEGIN